MSLFCGIASPNTQSRFAFELKCRILSGTALDDIKEKYKDMSTVHICAGGWVIDLVDGRLVVLCLCIFCSLTNGQVDIHACACSWQEHTLQIGVNLNTTYAAAGADIEADVDGYIEDLVRNGG